MVGPVAKREAVAHLQAVMGLSERRACGIVGADHKMVRYRSCRPPDTELRGHLRELANARRRFGYRRLFVLLRQQGEPSGRNRIYRLYREEGLSVRKRRARRRAVGICPPAAYAAYLTATCDRLRNPDQLRRSHVTHTAPNGVTSAETLKATG